MNLEKEYFVKQASLALGNVYNTVMCEFFSLKNINIIQQRLKAIVANETNKYTIKDQNANILYTYMMFIYMENGPYGNDDVDTEVCILTDLTAQMIKPKLLSGINQHLQYLEDINNPRQIMEHSGNVSNKGEIINMNMPGF